MNIEEIKVRLSNLNNGKIVKIDERIDFGPQLMYDYSIDVTYLLTIIEQAEKALEYYANLNQNAYHDAIEGELYSDWWARQSIVAIETLKAIRRN